MPADSSVGKLVAVIVLAALATPACQHQRDQSAWWENERERIELEQQLNLAAYRCGRVQDGTPGELATLMAGVCNLKQRQQMLRLTRYSLQQEILLLEQQCDDLAEKSVRAKRLALIGTRFESLRLFATRIFHHVTVTGIDDGGVSITHDHGAARLTFADLSPEQREFFGLDESAASAAANREAQQLLAYDQWLAQTTPSSLNNPPPAPATTSQRNPASNMWASLAAQDAARNRLRPLEQPARRLQGTIRPFAWSYPYGSTYYRYRPRYPTVY